MMKHWITAVYDAAIRPEKTQYRMTPPATYQMICACGISSTGWIAFESVYIALPANRA